MNDLHSIPRNMYDLHSVLSSNRGAANSSGRLPRAHDRASCKNARNNISVILYHICGHQSVFICRKLHCNNRWTLPYINLLRPQWLLHKRTADTCVICATWLLSYLLLTYLLGFPERPVPAAPQWGVIQQAGGVHGHNGDHTIHSNTVSVHCCYVAFKQRQRICHDESHVAVLPTAIKHLIKPLLLQLPKDRVTQKTVPLSRFCGNLASQTAFFYCVTDLNWEETDSCRKSDWMSGL